jgi:hypothetical protein
MREEKNVYSIMAGKPEGKRLLGRPRRRWEDGSWGDWLGECIVDPDDSG